MRFQIPRGCQIAIAVLAALVSVPAHAGNGGFKNGDFNFCVSVRFEATASELSAIRTAFQNGSQILADATDGQHKFGKITLVNDSGASQSSDYWVNPGDHRAYATLGRYGVRGEHVNLYFDANFQADQGANGDAYTIAHEHAHHAYGVVDEYSGPDGDAECAAPPDSATLNFSLMDNYFTRGGRSGGGATYTLNEFCVAANHDPDLDNFQEAVHGESAWETISSHPTRSASAPVGFPIDTPPAPHTVDFEDGFGGLRVMLLLDRSGSMSQDDRIEFARRGANVFTTFLREDDGLGVASFADGAGVNFPLTTITGSATRSAATSAINGLVASGSTNIGDGLLTSLGQITSQAMRSCNEIIVLLSDGDHNTGTPPFAALPTIQDERVTVLTVAVGSGISTDGEATLQNIASQTGGKFFRAASAFDLVGLFVRLVFESVGSGLLTRSPLDLASGESREVASFVEAGAGSASFVVVLAEPQDDITLSLRSPSGVTITSTTPATDPNVQFLADANTRTFRVALPEPGVWTAVVSAGTVGSGTVELLAFVEHDGVDLSATVRQEVLTYPTAVEVEATPRFAGQNVVGAVISGDVVRPDGSRVPIMLFDDGVLAHGDAMANDGVYAARFDDYSADGTYTFELRAKNETGALYVGEDLFVNDLPNTAPVPPFERSATTTAVVSGVPRLVTLVASKDAVLRKGNRNTNEGANPALTVGGSGPAQASIVGFDPSGVQVADVARAMLVLNVEAREDSANWGPSGAAVEAHALPATWIEGNGKSLGLPPSERSRGNGSGATWNCPVDDDVANPRPQCSVRWRGGSAAPHVSDSVPHVNQLVGEIRWDVTADVVAGASSWLLERRGARGTVRYTSREGATALGDPSLAPRLILEMAP